MKITRSKRDPNFFFFFLRKLIIEWGFTRKEIWIIEGKIEKDLNKGIKQLSDVHLNGFMGLLNKLYPDYDIKKGLCITISNIDYIDQYNNLEFPIKFALDRKGFFIKR